MGNGWPRLPQRWPNCFMVVRWHVGHSVRDGPADARRGATRCASVRLRDAGATKVPPPFSAHYDASWKVRPLGVRDQTPMPARRASPPELDSCDRRPPRLSSFLRHPSVTQGTRSATTDRARQGLRIASHKLTLHGQGAILSDSRRAKERLTVVTWRATGRRLRAGSPGPPPAKLIGDEVRQRDPPDPGQSRGLCRYPPMRSRSRRRIPTAKQSGIGLHR